MPTSFAAGEIYIIGEIDSRLGAETGFYKIGIVRDAEGRGSEERLKEHQTGNPRRLTICDVVKSEIVETVETTIHALYATSRFSGEWFVLDAKKKLEAIASIRRLALEASAGLASLRRADELRSLESSGDLLSPDDSILALHAEALVLKGRLKLLATLTARLEVPLRANIETDGGSNVFGTIITRKDTFRFDQNAFKEIHPDLWGAYLETTERLSGNFTLLGKVTESSGWEQGEHLERTINSLLYSGQDIDLESVHRVYLVSLGLEAELVWTLSLTEARIKEACGLTAGIEGVCKWQRVMKPTSSLNGQSLKNDHPEIYERFVGVRPGAQALVIAKDTGFRH